MERYKLIKIYPGSPLLGSESIDKFYEQYPEFWKKIVDKDYEILTIIDTNNSELIYNWDGTNFRHKFSCIVPESLKWNNIKIMSIKRLSDGEVFKINDKCTSLHYYTAASLNYISIKNNELLFYLGYSDNPTKLKHIKKYKNFLFKTKDGVEIFEGDCYYTVRDDFSLAKDGNGFHSKGLHFASKENAEEYILINKPCLSINDVMSVVNSYSSRLTGDVFKKLLKHFIKDK